MRIFMLGWITMKHTSLTWPKPTPCRVTDTVEIVRRRNAATGCQNVVEPDKQADQQVSYTALSYRHCRPRTACTWPSTQCVHASRPDIIEITPIYAARPCQKALLPVKMICQTRTVLSFGNLELSISNLNTLSSQRMMQTKAQMSSCLPQRSRSHKP